MIKIAGLIYEDGEVRAAYKVLNPHDAGYMTHGHVDSHESRDRAVKLLEDLSENASPPVPAKYQWNRFKVKRYYWYSRIWDRIDYILTKMIKYVSTK